MSTASVRGSLRADGRRAAVQPADVRGRFTRARRLTFAGLIGFYAALPWIDIGGHPAVFLDVAARKFYLFGATFNAQDVWMTVFLLLGAGFVLLYLTALLGRVWCGWACPQTVFLEAMYRPVERWLQGPRERRLRRNAGPWTWDRTWRAGGTHAVYLMISLFLAHVFLAYFVSIPALVGMMQESPSAHPEAFAMVAVAAGLLYFDFGWFREQTCVVVCPYGRLQSVLLDDDSLVVGYDARRGEPRGKVGIARAGDCVDCKRCVAVCPTGIDIREGLQLDCIACAACIDACDQIMVKLERPRGLIRYDSSAGLRGERRRILRPRVIGYTAALAALGLAGWLALRQRSDFEANLLRAVGMPYVVENGEVRNSFDVHLVNKRARRATFVVQAEPAPNASFTVPLPRVTLDSLADAHAPVVVTVPRAAFHGDFPVHIVIEAEEEPEEHVLTAQFLGPRP